MNYNKNQIIENHENNQIRKNKNQNNSEPYWKKFTTLDACNQYEKKNFMQLKNPNISNEEIKYYLQVMDILISYYTDYDNKSNMCSNDITNKPKINKKKIIYFNKKKMPIVEKIKQKDKKKLFEEYKYLRYGDTSNKKPQYCNLDNTCQICQNIKKINSNLAISICEYCGNCEDFYITTQKNSYMNGPVIEGNNFSYRKFDHFNEWLQKFNTNKKLKIPKKDYKIIHFELCEIKNKLNKLNQQLNQQNQSNKLHISSQITRQMCEKILIKTNLTKYNNHINSILNKFNNRDTSMPKYLQEQMKNMFKKTQKPFLKARPENRTNFLSYSYVIRKFLELLGENKYYQHFEFLKSREKLYEQDKIWKKICIELNWKFYPSV